MRKKIRKKGLNLLTLSLCFIAFLPGTYGHFTSCGEEVVTAFSWSISITHQTDDDISFGWGNDSNALYYRCWYVRVDDNYTSSVTAVQSNYIDYTGLQAGTYHFYFAKVGSSGILETIVIDDLIMG